MAGRAGIGAGEEVPAFHTASGSAGYYATPLGGTIEWRDNIINQISEAQPNEIQKIAASQIKLLDSYYTTVLVQATQSFRWALIAAGIGLAFFLGAIAFLLYSQSQSLALVSVVGGAIVEVISGINFFIYGKTTTQLADFHKRLDQTQRFLLANSICESLQGAAKDKSRADLVKVISSPGFEHSQLSSSEIKDN